MDPISQGAIGALAAQTSVRHKNLAKVTLVGCLAGLAPDLDVLIQSREDPILFLEYHRQFTHSLLFIPFGSLLVAIALLGFLKDSLNFKTIYLASFLGFATHGLLDACTSYGTQLFWPFSNTRVSWNNISIVDPLFTLPIIFLIITGLKTKRRLISFTAAGWAVIYLSLGFYQYERAFSAAMQVANARGHRAERLTLKPSFGNIILWKAIYQHDEYYFIDAIRTVSTPQWCSGSTIEMFDFNRHTPLLGIRGQQGEDVERFRWFSQDYLGYDSEEQLIADVRYSMLPDEASPMWGLRINSQSKPNEHASWWASRELSPQKLRKFTSMLSGNSCKSL